jgi:hypothetical protein
MRLVTWNCNKGPYAEKMALLDAMAADIAVIRECPNPEVESENCVWFDDNAVEAPESVLGDDAAVGACFVGVRTDGLVGFEVFVAL